MHYLYHIRDPETSCGYGYDGYIGITHNPKSRRKQHFDSLKKGCHHNEKLQTAFNQSTNGLQFTILTSGPKEQIEARERLLVPKPNHYWNKQIGGGHTRGMSKDQAIDAMFQPETVNTDGKSSFTDDKSTPPKSASSFRNTGAERASLAAVAVECASVVGLGATYLASGIGAAHALNKTVLKDEKTLDNVEKDARSAGRVASYSGGGVGAAASLTAVCVAGEFGLTAVGISTGLAGIGSTVGGGAVIGLGVTIAAPAVIAVAVGLGTYQFVKWIKK